MPRKGPAPKRPIDVDPVYGSQLGHQLGPVDRVDVERPLRGGTLARHQPFSFFAPYRLRACLRFFTPWVSSVPRMIL